MWLGHKTAYERAEGDRGELTVYCQRGQLLDCRRKKTSASQSSSGQKRKSASGTWMEWAQDEKRKRLGLSIYVSITISEIDANENPLTSSSDTGLSIRSFLPTPAIHQQS